MNDGEVLPESRWGIAALFVGLVPLAAIVVVTIAALLGVKDNQGFVYAFMIPFACAVFAGPVAALLGLVGYFRPRTRRRASLIGLALGGIWLVAIGVVAFRGMQP